MLLSSVAIANKRTDHWRSEENHFNIFIGARQILLLCTCKRWKKRINCFSTSMIQSSAWLLLISLLYYCFCCYVSAAVIFLIKCIVHFVGYCGWTTSKAFNWINFIQLYNDNIRTQFSFLINRHRAYHISMRFYEYILQKCCSQEDQLN